MEFKSSAPIFGPISDPHILINNTQLHTIHAKSLKWVSKNKVKLQSWITTMTPSHHQRKKLTFTSLLIVLTNQPNKQTKARIQIEDTNHRNRNEKELSNTCTRKATWNWDWKSKRVLEEKNLELRGIRRLWHVGVKAKGVSESDSERKCRERNERAEIIGAGKEGGEREDHFATIISMPHSLPRLLPFFFSSLFFYILFN